MPRRLPHVWKLRMTPIRSQQLSPSNRTRDLLIKSQHVSYLRRRRSKPLGRRERHCAMPREGVDPGDPPPLAMEPSRCFVPAHPGWVRWAAPFPRFRRLILPQNPDQMLDIRQLENGLERPGAPSPPQPHWCAPGYAILISSAYCLRPAAAHSARSSGKRKEPSCPSKGFTRGKRNAFDLGGNGLGV
jgi:hypothetical protein